MNSSSDKDPALVYLERRLDVARRLQAKYDILACESSVCGTTLEYDLAQDLARLAHENVESIEQQIARLVTEGIPA